MKKFDFDESNFNLLSQDIDKEIIEKYDYKLQDERDKKSLRHRGLKPDSIKTIMGVVEFKRTLYEYNENGQNKFVYLLDEHLQLSEYGKISKTKYPKSSRTFIYWF